MPDQNDDTSQPTRGGGNAFTRKLGPLPVWAWMAVGLGLAIAYSSWRKNKTAAASTPSTTTPPAGVQTAANTPPFVIQNYTQTAPGGGPVTQPSGSSGVGATGGNGAGSSNAVSPSGGAEPYLYGQAQIDYLNQHIGPGAYTQQIVSDVQKAFIQVARSQSAGVANSYHYSWIGPGNVQAIPKGAGSVSQIIQSLP